ncbi:UvrD-helicase domain-containing protein, partial [uncultured Alistipes sp.]|uniref:UvrD-helicase domain-containing protein n=1 Tax=uncultured Alistipes sp. TaxID=538949 RepID=UPI00260FB3DC
GAEAARSREELRRTAAEAVGIIAAAGCTVADFPYREKGFAAWFYAVAGGSTDRYGSRVEAACTDDARWGKTGTPSQRLRQQLQPLLRRLCELYDSNVRLWNTCGLLRENYRSFALLSDLYTRVQQLCDEQNTMLLSETKYVLSEFIGHNDAPFIYEKVGNRFDRFMIDEFQDTSVKEWENFLPLLRNAMAQAAPDETAVLLVGDIKQSIYRWRGGDWRLLHGAAREALGAADTQVVALQENYRSLPVVVEFNNRIIGRIVRSDNDELNRSLAEAAARADLPPQTAAELTDTLSEAYRNHAQQPRLTGTHPGYVSVETFDERPPVVERICELLDRGFRPGQIMILVRGATDGAKVAAELLEFKRRNTEERYRFDVMTQEALVVGNAPAASFIAAALRLALNPDDTLHRAVYNHYLGRAFDRPLDDEERTFFRSIRLLSPEEAFERIVMRHDIAGDRRQTAYLQAVHEQIIAFCSSKIADIPLWLQWWDETGSGRSLSVEASASAVEITTIHKAKGLEKSVVLIPYCSWQLDPKTNGVSNIVWAAARGDGSDAGCVPVRFRQSMAESGFSEEYYREKVYAHVDNINLLYVALTRARESLHVFLPQRSARTVGGLLRQSIPTEGGRALLDGLEGRCSSTERGERFEFGEFTGPEPPKKEQAARTEHAVLEHYPTSQADLRLRLPSQRYFEEEDEAELSPRNFGILMHRAFEHADDEEQIRRAVERMTADGTLSEAEAPVLRAAIARALEHPVVREWFGGGWQRVRNEHEIVIPAGNGPGSRTIRRPDRVMTAGRRAVVVDYKFGLREKESHRRQIGEYCDLLRQMGYTDVAGYLWYVKRGNIEKVTDEA